MLLTGPVRAALEGRTRTSGFGPDGGRADVAFLLGHALSHSVRLLYGAAAMAAIVFVVMIVLIVYYRDDLTILAGLSAAFGTGIAGLVTLVVRMSKSVTQAGVLLALVSQLPDEDALEALKALLRADSSTRTSDTLVAKSK